MSGTATSTTDTSSVPDTSTTTTTSTTSTTTGTTTNPPPVAADLTTAANTMISSALGGTSQEELGKFWIKALSFLNFLKSPLLIFFGPFGLFAGALILALSGNTMFAWLFALGAVIEIIYFYVMRYRDYKPKTPQETMDTFDSVMSYVTNQAYANLALICLSVAVGIGTIVAKNSGSAQVAPEPMPAAPTGGSRRR